MFPALFSQKTANTAWHDLLFLILFIGVLFVTLLGSRPLSVPDEARYSEIPREMVQRHDYVTPHLNDIKYFEKPPLFYWIQVGAIKTFGLSEWALRLPNALIALAGCIITYGGARALYGRRSGLISALMLATTVLYFGMAHLITLDMTLTTTLSGALLSFISALHYPEKSQLRRILLAVFYACCALATLTKGLVGILLPAFILSSWAILTTQWNFLTKISLFTGILIFFAIAAPWHILVQIQNPEFFHFYFIEQQFERYLTLSAGRYQPFWFFVPILLLGFFPWVVFLGQAIVFHVKSILHQSEQYKATLFLLIWAFGIFLFFSLSKSKLIPYILPVFPPLSILTARFLDKMWEEKKQRSVNAGFILLIILSILLSIFIVFVAQLHILNDIYLAKYFIGALAILFPASCLLVWRNYHHHALPRAFFTLIATSTVLLWTLIASIPSLDTRSIKQLAVHLKPLLKPGDEVAAFGVYYQDLPFYLQQKVTVVEWTNELSFGMQHQDASQWMISPQTFWQRWKSNHRIYMLIPKKWLQELPRKKIHNFYPVAQTIDNILIVNNPL